MRHTKQQATDPNYVSLFKILAGLVHLKSSGQSIKAKTPGQLVKKNKQLKQLFDECLEQVSALMLLLHVLT
jgi:hypothetical protein